MYGISPASWNTWKQQDLQMRAGNLPEWLAHAKTQPNVKEKKQKQQHPAGGRRWVESRLWHLFKHILHILMRRSKCCFNLAARCFKTHPAVGFKTRIWCDNIMKSTESVFWLQLSHNVLKISCIYVTLATWELHFKAVSFQHRVTVEKTTSQKKTPEQSSSCTTGQYRLH